MFLDDQLKVNAGSIEISSTLFIPADDVHLIVVGDVKNIQGQRTVNSSGIAHPRPDFRCRRPLTFRDRDTSGSIRKNARIHTCVCFMRAGAMLREVGVRTENRRGISGEYSKVSILLTFCFHGLLIWT